MLSGNQKRSQVDLTRGHPCLDTGTMCRNTNYAPRLTGLDLTLTVDESLMRESLQTLFRLTIKEALRRGARDIDLTQLRMGYLWSRQRSQLARGGQQDDTARRIEEMWTKGPS